MLKVMTQLLRFRIGALALAAMLALPGVAAAQETGVMVVGGLNVSKLSLPFPDFDFEELELTVENATRLGFAAGVLVDVNAARRAGFTLGALYSQRGTKLDAEVIGFGVGTIDFNMEYIEFPLLARFGVGGDETAFSVLAGGMIGIPVRARTVFSSFGIDEDESFTDALPDVDFGLTFGGRADFGRGSVTAWYTHGLTDLTEGLSPEPVKHRVFTVLAGWRF
jgi:hypothetical protein